LQQSPLDSLQVAGPQQSAAAIQEIFAGNPGARRDIVVLNAAAALWTAGKAATPLAAAQLAGEAIDSGAARTLLGRLIEQTNPR
jgi:anthranilate phosphoribosyltransferase